MVRWSNYGKVIGAELVAKGVERLAQEVDKFYVWGTGQKPWERPSVWINTLGLGVAVPVAGDKMRVKPETQGLLEVMGGHGLSQVFDYVEEAAVPATRTAASSTTVVRTNSAAGYKTSGVAVKNGRYRMVS